MNTTISYNYDPDIGLPIDALRGGITLVDDACHVKVWKDSTDGEVHVCIIPMYGKVSRKQVLTIPVSPLAPGTKDDGKYPAHYVNIKPTRRDLLPRIKHGQAIHGHEYYHVPMSERSQANWCTICKDWFVPSKLA